MTLLISVVAGIVPMVIYPLFVYWIDRYEKEPIPLLVAVFLWGFIPAAILSLISQLVLSIPFWLIDDSGMLGDALASALFAPLTEEIFKGMAVALIFFLWKREFDGVFDGIIYGSLVGFGFAAVENILYFASAGGGLGLLIAMRAFLFGLNHAFFTSLTGIGFGAARLSKSGVVRFLAPLAGLLAAIFFHSLHNSTLIFVEQAPALFCLVLISNWGGVLGVFMTMLFSVRREREWLVEQLRGEMDECGLPPGHYDIACSPALRLSTRVGALVSRGPSAWIALSRYFHALTELAYKKHARDRRGDEGATRDAISGLRASALAMMPEAEALIRTRG